MGLMERLGRKDNRMESKIYGMNSVAEFIKNTKLKEGKLFIARNTSKADSQKIIQAAERKNFEVIHKNRHDMDKMFPDENHQGIAISFKLSDSPQKIGLGELINQLEKKIKNGELPTIAILDQIQDPGNLGAIIRSAAQFNISSIIIPEKNASPLTPASIKSAVGGDQFVDIITTNNLARAMEDLQKIGFWIAAADSDGKSKIEDIKMNTPFCIIIGSEGKGVRKLLKEKSDFLISIPTTNKLDSLNASVSAGILFYEIFKATTSKK